MRVVLAWIKSNLILVVSAAVCLASLGALIYVHARGAVFVARVTQRYDQNKKFNDLSNTTVHLPPARPDDRPIVRTITVNRKAIDSLKDIYGQMSREYLDIYKYAVGVNSQGHLPMLDGLFPEPGSSPTRSFEAKFFYQTAFRDYFKPYSPSADHPQLDAAPAPSESEIKTAMDRAQAEFMSNNLSTTLTDEETQRLKQFRSKKLTEYLMSYAKNIHLYAESNPQGKEFPFEVMEWSRRDTQPDARDLWEAQMQMWIIQDITRAIAQTNRVDNPEVNVMNAPIKRLMSIRVVPGYLGITGRGDMGAGGPTDKQETNYHPLLASSGGGPGGGPGMMRPGGGPPLPPPQAGQTRAPTIAVSAVGKLPDDFSLSATGRRSNEIYDVRQVWLTLVMDAQRMPEFFDNLAQVNFMTVLKIEVTDVDEYAAAKEGYVYGPGDAVKVQMLVETIWLRDWTLKLMPQVVRDQLVSGTAAVPQSAE